MTEKRYYCEDNCVGYYTEFIDKKKELDLNLSNPKKNLTVEEVVDRLNKQHETIQQSRKELSDYSCTIIQLQDKVNVREALLKQLEDENEQLKSEIDGIEELLKSYRKTIKHDAELLADASKKGYLPPLENWREL